MIFTGVDIGGTNTDIAIVEEGVLTRKVPNDGGLKRALASFEIRGRLAVSTSQPLNRLVCGPPLFGAFPHDTGTRSSLAGKRCRDGEPPG